MNSRSRRMFRARFGLLVRPSSFRGRRECRAPDAPASRVCKNSGSEHTRWSGHTGNRPAFPAQWFTAYFALSPATGFFATVIPEKLASQELDASIGASGPHDFAVRTHTPFVKGASASTTSRPAFVTIASRPSEWDGTAGEMKVICANREAKYFFAKGWTAKSLICPSGCRTGTLAAAKRSPEKHWAVYQPSIRTTACVRRNAPSASTARHSA